MTLRFSPRPIQSVLIANRGEIARRVQRTCRRLGLRVIAVYSDADADAPFVHEADQAVRLGPAPARDSYLNIPALLAAARESGADAVHPGYGFLSENAAFAAACEEAGLIFIGPSPRAVAQMGSKAESKRLAIAAGVPVVPGYHGEAQDVATLSAEAKKIGYPVLIKASAGGGGRGMRRVDRPADFAVALEGARREAESAFGDGRVLLEKFILNPRHLEVQLAGDRLGNLVHLFERDCSVQRNNQKVLEEAPAPNLSEKVRSALFEAALKLGHAIGYDSVGTVEFIMDAGSDQPYFLEMNTRLQVEHPVTEAITGVDLVEWQLRSAAGETLPSSQDQIRCQGHAIEARLTAERADRDFQSVTGRVETLIQPPGLRFDSAVEPGSEISLYYDSLIAKMIAHGRDRDEARRRLVAGLDGLVLLGVTQTQAFLRDALKHPLFTEGRATTRFIPEAFPEGWAPAPHALRRLRALAAAAWLLSSESHEGKWTSPWQRPLATRVTAASRPAKTDLVLADDYGEAEAQVLIARGEVSVLLDGENIGLGTAEIRSDRFHVMLQDGPAACLFRRDVAKLMIAQAGLAIVATVQVKADMPRASDKPESGGNLVFAPLHGLISAIHVTAGQRVSAGTAVLQMEAMKLVHSLPAPVSGIVQSIRQAVGQTVPAGAILIEIAPDSEEENV